MTPILVRDARESERQQTLRIALGEPDLPTPQVQKFCEMTEAFLKRCGGSIGGLHLAETQGRAILACAALDLPGRVSLLMLPMSSAGSSYHQALVDLLVRAGQAARDRNMRFAQIMLEPEVLELAESRIAPPIQTALLEAGFHHLARLQYLQRNAYDPTPIQPIEQTHWQTLDQTDPDTFAEVILRTYVDSQDCPGLTGVRSMRDILDSHRGAGEFDPHGWYLLYLRNEPAGVLITARTPFRTNLEVVYVGLVPAARGQGLGRICMHRAIQRARDLALSQVTLAVDAANLAAGRLYGGLGFTAYATKDVWIQVYRRADAEGLFTLPPR